MPHDAPRVKVAAVEGYGAQITYCNNTPREREAALSEVVARTGAAFIHPFNDYGVIAGQATAAMELIEDTKAPLDCILAPVGGEGCLRVPPLPPATLAYGRRSTVPNPPTSTTPSVAWPAAASRRTRPT